MDIVSIEVWFNDRRFATLNWPEVPRRGDLLDGPMIGQPGEWTVEEVKWYGACLVRIEVI